MPCCAFGTIRRGKHARRDGEVESEDPDGIDRVTEEFMVCLVTSAVKDAQVEEKHCYHCSSPEHFICNCLFMKAWRENMQLNCKEGMVSKKGAQAPQTKTMTPKDPPGGGSQGIKQLTQTPFLNPDPFQCRYGVKNIAKVKINRERCMALLDNGHANQYHHI